MKKKPKLRREAEPDRSSVDNCVDSPSSPRRKRHPTCDHILASAKRVLIEQGYAGFTTRLVADTAGISPGNLSYHFPSRTELLQAMVGQLVDEYASQFSAFLSRSSIAPERQLEFLVEWLLTDAVARESMRTFRELWAISLHDEVVRRSVDKLYDVLMEGVVRLLQGSHPKADIKSIRELVQMLALISEGSIVLYGTERNRQVPFDRIIQLVTPLLGSIAPDVKIAAFPG